MIWNRTDRAGRYENLTKEELIKTLLDREETLMKVHETTQVHLAESITELQLIRTDFHALVSKMGAEVWNPFDL